MKKILIIVVVIVVCMVAFTETAVDQTLTDSHIVPQETDFLSLTGIKEIPAWVFNKTNLKNLSVLGQDCDIVAEGLECYAIHEIPKEIGKLKNLEKLSLTLNYIEKLPKEILELKRLTVLDLTDNPNFKDVETVGKMKQLKEFYCYGCYLSEKEVTMLKLRLPNCTIETE